MRIASLLPSATEIVCAIGLADELVAVTHECDFPPSMVGRSVVTRNAFDPVGARSRDIHDRVTAAMHGGSSIYELDEDALAAAEPDLVLTQELCRVCAVSYEEVNDAVRRIDADITVVSLEPTSIEGIFNSISTIGAMTEAEDAAMDLVASLRERLSVIETRVAERRAAGHRAPRVVAVEWLDPPFAVGHWVPEQIRRAGGWDLLGIDGGKAVETTWDAVVARGPRDAVPDAVRLPPGRDHLRVEADPIAALGRRHPCGFARGRSSRSTARPTTAARARG